MKINVGLTDRLIRLIVAAVLLVIYLLYPDTFTGTLGIATLIVAAIMVLTGLTRRCPLFTIFGIGSCPIESKK